MFAIKNIRGELSKENKKLADEIFNSVLLDCEGTLEKFDILSQVTSLEIFKGWYIRGWMQAVENVEIFAKLKKGHTAAVRNQYGQGSAIRIATSFFQQHLSAPEDHNLWFLKELIPASEKAVSLLNKSFDLRLRKLLKEFTLAGLNRNDIRHPLHGRSHNQVVFPFGL